MLTSMTREHMNEYVWFLHSRDEYLCLSCFSVVVNLRDSHLKKV